MTELGRIEFAGIFGELFGKKGIYYLLTIVSLGLVLSAGMKWHG